MNISGYAFHKCDDYWLCKNPIGNNWFICMQQDPLIIIEFDHDTQTGKIVGTGHVVGGKVQNRKAYSKEVEKAIEFTKAYITQEQNK